MNVLCAWVAFFNRQSTVTWFRRRENVKRWIWSRIILVVWPQHVSTWYPYPNGRPQVFNALHRTTLNMFSDGVVWIPPAYGCFQCQHDYLIIIYRVDSRLAPSQWETSLQSNAVKSPASRLFTQPFIRAQTSKLRVTGRCVGNSPGPVNSTHKWPVTRKMFPFDDVIMLWNFDGAAVEVLECIINFMPHLTMVYIIIGQCWD